MATWCGPRAARTVPARLMLDACRTASPMPTSVLLIVHRRRAAIEADLAALGVRVAARCAPARCCATRCAAAARRRCRLGSVSGQRPADGAATRCSSTRRCRCCCSPAMPTRRRSTQALRSGVHAYVVNGYAPARLRPLLQLARARFEREAALRSAHAELAHRFEERKLVDRAKGILMRARQIAEDEAFRLLRRASMQDQQRVGQVSRRVIDAARDAEAVNRAGQLRMLSQRIVKLYALRLRRRRAPAAAQALLDESARTGRRQPGAARARRCRATPSATCSTPSAQAWRALQPALRRRPRTRRALADVDAAAERLLGRGRAPDRGARGRQPAGARWRSSTAPAASACCRSAWPSRRCWARCSTATRPPGRRRRGGAQHRGLRGDAARARAGAVELAADPRRAGARGRASGAACSPGLRTCAHGGGPRGRSRPTARRCWRRFERLTELYGRGAQQLVEAI